MYRMLTECKKSKLAVLYMTTYVVAVLLLLSEGLLMMPAFRVEDGDVTGSGTRLHGVITQKERT